MPYPLSLHGKAPSELSDVQSTLDRIETALREAKARDVKREGESIRFKGSFMSRRFGGSVLTVVSWGTIRVARTDSGVQAEYGLHFLRNHLVRGAVSAAAFGAIYFGVKTADLALTVAAGTAFWVLLASLDYMLAATLFPRYLASKLMILND